MIKYLNLDRDWKILIIKNQSWSLDVKYVKPEDLNQENIATKNIENHRTKKRYQADTVFLSYYLVDKTEIEVLKY